MEEINRKLAEANARLEAVLQTLNILSQADEADAQAALKKKEANEEYHRLWEEIFALEEEQMQLADAQLKDPAYDGSSPTLTKEEELAFHRANAMKEKAMTFFRWFKTTRATKLAVALAVLVVLVVLGARLPKAT